MSHIKKIFCITCSLLIVGCSTLRTSQQTTGNPLQAKIDYLFAEATRQKTIGNNEAAFDIYNHILALDSLNSATLNELAQYQLSLQNYGLAFEMMQKAAALEPYNYWYNIAAANMAQGLNQQDIAIKLLQKSIKNFPDKPEINFLLSSSYVEKKEYANAISALDQLEKAMGIIEPVSIEKFKLYDQLNLPEKGFEEITKLQNKYPYAVQYPIMYGDMRMQELNYEKAIAAYNQAAAIDSTNGFLQISLARYYKTIGDSIKSTRYFEKAIQNSSLEVADKTEILKDYITRLLRQKGNTEKLDYIFAQLIQIHPQEEEIHKLYADFLVSQKRWNHAIEQLIIATDLAPTNQENWLQLMGCYLQTKNFDATLTTATQGMEYLPTYAQLYYYAAIALVNTGKIEEAVTMLQKGLPHTEDNLITRSDFYAQLGDLYHQLKKTELSYASYEEAIKYNEKNAGALNNYSYFLSLESKDLPKAERMASKAVQIESGNGTYLDTLAWIFFQQGNYSLAKMYIEMAINTEKAHSSEVLEHYGDILYMSGEKEKAVEQWQNALKTGSKSQTLMQKIKDKKIKE